MASAKKGCKVRVLVRLRPECPDFMDKASGGSRNGNPDNCERAVDASTLEVWNCRNPDESIQYRYRSVQNADCRLQTADRVQNAEQV